MKQQYGLAYLDLTSGRFLLTEVSQLDDLYGVLQRLPNPAELLYSEELQLPDAILSRKGARRRPVWELKPKVQNVLYASNLAPVIYKVLA